MFNKERLEQVKEDIINGLQENKDLIESSKIDLEKLLIKNEIYLRCSKLSDENEKYKSDMEFINKRIIIHESHIAEFIDTIHDYEIELEILKDIINKQNNDTTEHP